MFKQNKSKSMKKKKKEQGSLSTYDKFNLPLRTASMLNQGSRETRSWIRLARDAGLV